MGRPMRGNTQYWSSKIATSKFKCSKMVCEQSGKVCIYVGEERWPVPGHWIPIGHCEDPSGPFLSVLETWRVLSRFEARYLTWSDFCSIERTGCHIDTRMIWYSPHWSNYLFLCICIPFSPCPKDSICFTLWCISPPDYNFPGDKNLRLFVLVLPHLSYACGMLMFPDTHVTLHTQCLGLCWANEMLNNPVKND